MVATESLSLRIASVVVASLVVSRYEKAHPHAKWKIIVYFLRAFVNELWLTKEE